MPEDSPPSERLNFTKALWLIVGVALAVRLAWVVLAAHEPEGLTDMSRYLASARGIARGEGYVDFSTGEPTAYYPPGYPLFIGFIAIVTRPLGLFDSSLPQAIGAAQAFLGAASVLFLGRLGPALWSPRVGLVAAAGLALYPNLVMHTSGVLSETLYIFLILAALLVLLEVPFAQWSGRSALARAGGFGLLFGMAALVRPIALPALALVVLVWLRGRDWDRRAALRWTAAAVVACVGIMGAWTVRNVVRMDELVIMSTNTGDNLCIGHTDQATGGFHLRPGCETESDVRDGTAGEVAHDRELTRRAIRWSLDNPGSEPRLMASRIYNLFHTDDDAVLVVQDYVRESRMTRVQEGIARVAANVAYALVGVGGLLALALRRQWYRGVRRQLFVATMVVMAVVPLAFFGDPRFKVPLVPFFLLFAATLVAPYPADDLEAAISSD